MSDHADPAVELVGTAAEGAQAAVIQGLSRAAKICGDVDWFEVTSLRGHVRNGEIDHFQVTVKCESRTSRP